ncbi:MAG: restriction endonuclease [Gammaproteobacteria bacterium]|nr:restriction endonuclease [Gammaproteobacteria bacterium]
MDNQTKNKIISILDELEQPKSPFNGFQAEQKYMEVLTPLLSEDGYHLTHTGGQYDEGVDAIGVLPQTENTQKHSIGIQFKYYKSGRPTSISTVREVIGAAILKNFNRMLLVTNTKFTRNAREQVAHDLPLDIELIDIDSLRAWVARLEISQDAIGLEVRIFLKNVSRQLAEMIAKNPEALKEIEWRDLERIIAEVFTGLGFESTLTPGSKDGGKDIILECEISNQKRSYIVEIKHWRSGVRVGHGAVGDFLHVIAKEKRNGGLFLSTYGYCDNAFEHLTKIERRKLRFGAEEKVVGLCRSYVKAKAGIWSAPQIMEEVLFENTK